MPDNRDDALDYRIGDTTFLALGGEAGIARLVDRFYTLMETLPEAAELRAMHPSDLGLAREKLAAFFCGWTGGPERYSECFGTISLPMSHSHLAISPATKAAWMQCMAQALNELAYPERLQRYFLTRLDKPAESMRMMSEYRQSSAGKGGDFYDATKS